MCCTATDARFPPSRVRNRLAEVADFLNVRFAVTARICSRGVCGYHSTHNGEDKRANRAITIS